MTINELLQRHQQREQALANEQALENQQHQAELDAQRLAAQAEAAAEERLRQQEYSDRVAVYTRECDLLLDNPSDALLQVNEALLQAEEVNEVATKIMGLIVEWQQSVNSTQQAANALLQQLEYWVNATCQLHPEPAQARQELAQQVAEVFQLRKLQQIGWSEDSRGVSRLLNPQRDPYSQALMLKAFQSGSLPPLNVL